MAVDPILAARLQRAAEPVAEFARQSSARWSRRVPASVKIAGGVSRVTIVAGGPSAPQAYTMEGHATGRPVSHPVYGHGPRNTWHWVKQTPRPFMREAIDAKQDEMVRIFAGVVDDWGHQLGYR